MTDINETLKERQSRYGEFRDNSEISQAFKLLMREADQWEYLQPYQKEALEMIMHKIARILCGDPDYPDSWKDIAGYATRVYQYLPDNWDGDSPEVLLDERLQRRGENP